MVCRPHALLILTMFIFVGGTFTALSWLIFDDVALYNQDSVTVRVSVQDIAKVGQYYIISGHISVLMGSIEGIPLRLNFTNARVLKISNSGDELRAKFVVMSNTTQLNVIVDLGMARIPLSFDAAKLHARLEHQKWKGIVTLIITIIAVEMILPFALDEESCRRGDSDARVSVSRCPMRPRLRTINRSGSVLKSSSERLTRSESLSPGRLST